MSKHLTSFTVRLFYSYCHKDEQYRESMETSLAFLRREKALTSWSDKNILSGQKISERIKKNMEESDIMVFLISQNFIASEECMKEWENAKQLIANGKLLFRIPIILADCAWKDMLNTDEIKVLPKDGVPVACFPDTNVAWQQVYDGIKAVINEMRSNFTPKQEFLEEISKTGFLSQQNIKLEDLFIFLPLLCYPPPKRNDQILEEEVVNQEQLLKKNHVLIHGEEMSGKTALGRHLFLWLVEKSAPVLHMDLKRVSGRSRESFFSDTYSQQFNGDYSLWMQQEDKTLILDNLSPNPDQIDFALFAKKHFNRLIITLTSDIFISYFRDDRRLVDFSVMEIRPLTHKQQETLIKKRLALLERNEPLTDGFIDQVEGHVNSITTHHIVPRYPFYVLTILQTYEGYMPSNLSITSYGHCYYVLILANLIKAGISHSDNDINSCLHFAENLAFYMYQCVEKRTMNTTDFDRFVRDYTNNYLISDSILNRLKHHEFGIITKDGDFRTSYMCYFFLGRFLSKNREKHKILIENMCEKSYMTANYLTLLFIIHHTDDNQIIEDILLRTTCTFDAIYPATLDRVETKRFGHIRANLSKNILSKNSVDEEREKERNARDNRDNRDHQSSTEGKEEQAEYEDPVNDLYRVLKNNEILGQILRNKYGSLEKTKIEEIIEAVADSGLRLVNFILKDENEITEVARYIQKKYPHGDIGRVERLLCVFSFLWTMTNIEKIVSAINHQEIRKVVNDVVRKKSTPAYDLIGYFSQLDSAEEFTEAMKKKLGELLKKHDDQFLKGVLSIRTQHYINTHRSKTRIEQSVCSLLDIKYRQRTVR